MTRLGSFWRRNTMTIGIVVIICAFGAILFLQAVATSKLQEQTKQQQQILAQIKGVTEQIARSSSQTSAQIDTINRHLDCIVVFFTAPDRATKTITDIDTCTVQSTTNGGITTLPTASNSPAPAATTPKSNTQSSTSPAPAASGTPTPPAQSPPSGGSSTPSVPFLQRVIINPIKSIINAL